MTDQSSGKMKSGTGPKRGEFGRIRDFFAPLTGGHPDSFGLMDDAALLKAPDGCELVVTTDSIVRDIHFLAADDPADIAAKLLRVNLSDLAAKGAEPLAYSLAMALPSSVEDGWVEAFARQLGEEQDRFGIRLLGGDSVRTKGPEVLTVTAFGLVPAGGVLLRSGASDGDHVYVSGTIGDGALGLMAARGDFRGLPGIDHLIRRYRIPQPRLELGAMVRPLVGGAMDVSDGLVGDLAALASASNLGARLFSAKVPLSEPAAEILALEPDLMATVLTGGDDYELLLTVPAAATAEFEALSRQSGINVTHVGEMVGSLGAGQVEVLDADARLLPLERLKFSHG